MKTNIKKYVYMILSAMLAFAVFAGVGSVARQKNTPLVSEEILERQVVSSASAASWASGSYNSGTTFSSGDIVYIANATDMERFDAIVSSGKTCSGVTFYLTNNISYGSAIEGTFSGTLMSEPGKFFKISAGIIGDASGFFETLSGATIRNIELSVTITCTIDATFDALYIGGLAGVITNSTIDGCTLLLGAWAKGDTSNIIFVLACLGGVAGLIDGNTTISNNNISAGVVKLGAEGFSFMGSIAGATGTIGGASGTRYFRNNVIDGIISDIWSGSLSNTQCPLIGENYAKSNTVSNVSFPTYSKTYTKTLGSVSSYNYFTNIIHTSNTSYNSINDTVRSNFSGEYLSQLLIERSGSTTKVKSPNTGLIKLVRDGSSKVVEYTRNGGSITVGNKTYNSSTGISTLFTDNQFALTTGKKLKVTFTNKYGQTISNRTDYSIPFFEYADRNLVIEVKYETPYTVTFNTNASNATFPSGERMAYIYSGTQKLLSTQDTSSEITNLNTGSVPKPVRAGYMFAGYATSSSATKPNFIECKDGVMSYMNMTINTSVNLTLYAVWTEITNYSITYNLNGGSFGSGIVAPTTYKTTVNTPIPKPVRIGYTFQCWKVESFSKNTKEEANVTSNFILGETIGTIQNPTISAGRYGDVRLIALWDTEINYSITYNMQGGLFKSDGIGPNKYTTSGSTILTRPIKTGYIFAGWKITAASKNTNEQANVTTNWTVGTLVTAEDDYTIPSGKYGNITLTAQWTAINYSITYGIVGGSFPTGAVPSTYSINGSTTLPSPTKAGYTFAGWKVTVASKNTNEQANYTHNWTIGDNIGTTIPSGKYGDITLTAQWTAINYSITYNFAGGSISTGPSTYSITGSTTLPSTTRTGYTFSGWKISAISKNSSEQANVTSNFAVDDVLSISIPDGKYGNITISAQWTAKLYPITYKNPDETILTIITDLSIGRLSTVTSSHTYDIATTIGTIANRTGYTFAGWYKDSACTISQGNTIGGKEYTSGITLYARWVPKTYQIYYANPDGTAITTSFNPSIGRLNSGAILYHIYDTTTTISTTAVRTGYVFDGWFNDTALTNRVTSIGGKEYTSNIALYAKWTKIDYSISYNFAGGSLPAGLENPSVYKITDTISLERPTRYGYTFVDWMISTASKNANEQANVTTNWTVGTNIETSIPFGKYGNITLTAVWEANIIVLNFVAGVGSYDSSSGVTTAYVRFDSNIYYSNSACTQPLTYNINQSVTDLKIPVAKAGEYFAGYKYNDNFVFFYNYNSGTLTFNGTRHNWIIYTGDPITLTAVYYAAPITLATSDDMPISPNTNFYLNGSSTPSDRLYFRQGETNIYVGEARTTLLTSLTYEKEGYSLIGFATESGVTSTDDVRCLLTYSGTALTLKSSWNQSVGILYPMWDAYDVTIDINANPGSEVHETEVLVNGEAYNPGLTNVKFGSSVEIRVTVPYGYNVVVDPSSTTVYNVTRLISVYAYIDTAILTYTVNQKTTNFFKYTITPKTISGINVVNYDSDKFVGSTGLSSGPASFKIQNVKYGQLLPQISAGNIPTRAGYTFLGYSRIINKTNNIGADVYYRYNGSTFVESTPWRDIANGDYSSEGDIATLYAIWAPNQYNVTFNANGGSFATTPQTIQATFDSKIYKLNGDDFVFGSDLVPTRGGYIFLGFTTTRDDANTIIVSFDGTNLDLTRDYTHSQDSVFYALWAPDTNTTYKINIYRMNLPGRNPVTGAFETNKDSTGYTKFETKIKTGTTGQPVDTNLPSFAGFALYTGHASATSMTGLVISYGLEINIYYERLNYTLSIVVPNGDNGFASYAAGSTTQYTPYEEDNMFYFDEAISVADSIKNGYVFAGYIYRGEPFVAQNNLPISVKMVSSNSTIELQTDLVSYEIRLNLGSDIATWSDSLTPISGIVYMTYNVEQGVILPLGTAGAHRLGYTLTGWKLTAKSGTVVGKYKNSANPNGTASDAALSIGNEVISIGVGSIANLEFEAVWTPNRYKVVFDSKYLVPRTENTYEDPFDGTEYFAYAEYDSNLLYTTNDRYNPTVFTTYPVPSRVGYKFIGYDRFTNYTGAADGYTRYITANYVDGSVDSYTLSSIKFAPKTIPSSNEFTVNVVYEAQSVNYRVNAFLMNADGTFSSTKTMTFVRTATADTQIDILASNFTSAEGDILASEYVAVDTAARGLYVLPDGSAEIDLLFKRKTFTLSFAPSNIGAQHSLTISDNFVGLEDYRPIAGSYYWGSSITVTAVLKNGYRFGSLSGSDLGSPSIQTENIGSVGTNNVYKTTYSFTMPKTSLTSTQNIEKIEYTVLLDFQLLDDDTTTYFIDSASITLPVPTSTGYVFMGWKLTQISSDSLVYDTTAKLNESAVVGDIIASILNGSFANIELEAQWSLIEYTVTYNPNGGDVYKTSDKYVFENAGLPNGTTTALPKTVVLPIEVQVAGTRLWRNGYKFDGWKVTAIEGSATGIIVGEDNPTEIEVGDILLEIVGLSHANISVEAQWTLFEYTYTFDVNGGTIKTKDGSPNFATSYNYSIISGDQILPTSNYPSDLYLDGDIYKLPFSREGYKFAGWKIVSVSADPGYNTSIIGVKNGGITNVSTGDIITAIKSGSFGNITFEAQWTLIQYTYSFDMNGGTINTMGGSPSFALSNPYSITSSDQILPTSDLYNDGGVQKMPLIRDGYMFIGWKIVSITAKDGHYASITGVKEGVVTAVSVGDIITEIKGGSYGNITLEAQWELLDYSYSFNMIGGTINSKNGSPNFADNYVYTILSDDQVFPTSDYSRDLYLDPADGTYKMPFSRDGYKFTGWKITSIHTADGYNTSIIGVKNGVTTQVFNGDIITAIKSGSFGNVILEAQWAPKLSYVTFDAMEGDMNIGTGEGNINPVSKIENVEVTYRETNAFTSGSTKIDYIKKAGYVFAGWYLKGATNVKVLDENNNYVSDVSQIFSFTIPGTDKQVSENVVFSSSGEWTVFSKYFEEFPTGRITLEARWEAVKYTVELDKNWDYIPLESGENPTSVHNYEVQKSGSNFDQSIIYESNTYILNPSLTSFDANLQTYTYIYENSGVGIRKEYRLYPSGTFILPQDPSNVYSFNFNGFDGGNPRYDASSSMDSGTMVYRNGEYYYGSQKVSLSFMTFETPIVYTTVIDYQYINPNLISHTSLTKVELTYGSGTSLVSGYSLRGHKIKGWALTPGGTPIISGTDAKILNLITIPNGVTRLYAIWEAETYNYTFEIQTTHETNNPRENLTVKKSETVSERFNLTSNSTDTSYTATRTYGEALTFKNIYTMTRLGYKLQKYIVKDDSFETSIEGIAFDSIDNGTIYKAKWILDPITVNFMSDSALLDGTALESKHGALVLGGDRVGKVESQFYVNSTSTTPYFAIERDTTYANDSAKVVDSNTIGGRTISKTGYNFLGWFIAQYNASTGKYTVTNIRVDSLTIDSYAQLDAYKHQDNKVVIVAVWTPMKFKLTIVIGYCYDDSIVDGTQVTAINPEAAFAYRKYQLGNITYTTVNSLVPFVKRVSVVVDGHSVMQKVYCLEAVTSYDSEYVIPGYIKTGTGYAINNRVQLPDGSTSQILARNGYNFFGWYESITSSGVPVGGEIGFISAQNIKNNLVIANIKGASYNITYNPGKGIITGPTTNSYTYGDTVTLPTASELVSPGEGYTFDGWYLGGLPADEKPDASLRVTAINSTDFGDKKFYALWLLTQISSDDGKVVIESQSGISASYTLKVNDLTSEYKFYEETKQVRKNFNILAFYDVILLRNNIATVQPASAVTIKLKVPDGTTDTVKLKVVAIGDDGSYEVIESNVEGGYVVFSTDTIAYFAIATEGEGITSTADIPTWIWGVVGGSMMLIGVVSLLLYFTRRKKRRAI